MNEARRQGRFILRYSPCYLGNDYDPLNEPAFSLCALGWGNLLTGHLLHNEAISENF